MKKGYNKFFCFGGCIRNFILRAGLFGLIALSLCLLSPPAQADDRGALIRGQNFQGGRSGKFKALVIGIDDYRDPHIQDLKTAVNDARAIAEVLSARYNFGVKLLTNKKATRENIYSCLRSIAGSAGDNDSVLIYYGGHGELDRQYKGQSGWWIPHDATAGKESTYLDNNEVQKAMANTDARHVLLISDSCYAGSLFGTSRGLLPSVQDQYYRRLYNEKSRWGMTSGNKTPVSDDGFEGHSVFAYQLIKTLQRNTKPYLSVLEIFTQIAPIVSNNSEQTPVCKPIKNTGDQGGQFIFISTTFTPTVKKAPISPPVSKPVSKPPPPKPKPKPQPAIYSCEELLIKMSMGELLNSREQQYLNSRCKKR